MCTSQEAQRCGTSRIMNAVFLINEHVGHAPSRACQSFFIYSYCWRALSLFIFCECKICYLYEQSFKMQQEMFKILNYKLLLFLECECLFLDPDKNKDVTVSHRYVQRVLPRVTSKFIVLLQSLIALYACTCVGPHSFLYSSAC